MGDLDKKSENMHLREREYYFSSNISCLTRHRLAAVFHYAQNAYYLSNSWTGDLNNILERKFTVFILNKKMMSGKLCEI